MNVSELARKLRINTQELLEILPTVGFDIGRRAIKIDDRVAQKIIQNWSRLLSEYKEGIEGDQKGKEEEKETKPVGKSQIAIPSIIRVKDFAAKLGLPLPKVMAELMKNGVLSSMNEQIDFDTASIVGQYLGFEIISDTSFQQEKEEVVSKRLENLLAEEDKSRLKSRPPVVVVMGHVDHGKTKLLDTIRKTNVVEGEHGGITQHIGAYQVTVPERQSSRASVEGSLHVGRDDGATSRAITFIDTPGHEAFTTMRSRGARVADIAILVVAADDGIQPQTKESIKIINLAGLPMIVAINKIDKQDADPDRVRQELAALNLTPEEWGGNTICLPISAKEGIGIDDLLEMILLVTETEREEIMANPDRPAVGTIIDSRIDKGEGPVATVLVQNGTLRRGDLITVADTFYGKIRAMKNFKGENITEARPSTPAKVLGLKATPGVGDILQVITEIDRKSKVKKYQLREQAVAYSKPLETKENKEKNIKLLNIVLKADVLGSLEAIITSLLKLEHPEVAPSIIAKGLGNINESDILRAADSGALLLGFNVKPTLAAENLAKEKKVEIKIYHVIYHLIDEVRNQLEKLLIPEVIRTELGRLKVLAIFYQEKNSMVVGGQVTKGKILPKAKVDVIRDGKIITTGNIVQLQINKVDVNEADHGKECGIKYEGKPVIEVGDILEVYTEEIKIKKIT